MLSEHRQATERPLEFPSVGDIESRLGQSFGRAQAAGTGPQHRNLFLDSGLEHGFSAIYLDTRIGNGGPATRRQLLDVRGPRSEQ